MSSRNRALRPALIAAAATALAAAALTLVPAAHAASVGSAAQAAVGSAAAAAAGIAAAVGRDHQDGGLLLDVERGLQRGAEILDAGCGPGAAMTGPQASR